MPRKKPVPRDRFEGVRLAEVIARMSRRQPRELGEMLLKIDTALDRLPPDRVADWRIALAVIGTDLERVLRVIEAAASQEQPAPATSDQAAPAAPGSK